MLHTGILPHHTKWVRLFENLRYVVIDELHTYRGVFGSHVANVLRRLRRICRFYGSDPIFICCSATIANPRELARALIDSAGRAGRRQRRAAGREAHRALQPAGGQPGAGHPPQRPQRPPRRSRLRLVQDGAQTIVFRAQPHDGRAASRACASALQDAAGRAPSAVEGYRSGYLPSERRDIEARPARRRDAQRRRDQRARAGHRHRRAAGGGAHGLPGHARQRLAAAGPRRPQHATSLAVLVAGSSPLDQYVARTPTTSSAARPSRR